MLSSILAVFGVIIAFFSAKYLFVFYNNWRKFKHIPGFVSIMGFLPIRIPILAPLVFITAGFIHQYDDGPDLIRSVSKNGICKLTRGSTTNIVVSSAELIKEVVVKNQKDYPKPSEGYKILELYGPNIVSTNDDVWKNHRAIADPAFAEKHFHFLVADTVGSSKLLFERWNKEGLGSGRLNTNPDRDMTDITLDVIGKVNFGYDLQVFNENRTFDKNKHEMSFFESLSIAATYGLLVRGRVPDMIQPLFKKTNLAVKETKLYMQELIDYRVEHFNEARHDLFSLLVDSNMNQQDQDQVRRRLTDNELISDVFIYLLAGHETSTTTLQWIIYELCLNPHIQQKACDEVDQLLSNRDPVFEDYEKLEYLRAILDETLRLHPPVAMVPKVARRDVTLGDYQIPKGTYIDIAISTVQTSEDYFEEPLKWIPERWIQGKKITTCSYLPFSFGLRRCIGNVFSMVETVTILAMILKNYTFEFPKNDPRMDEIIRTGKIDTYTLVTKKPKYLRADVVVRNKK
ncbi:cytochrome P450 [Acrasis kona]|uniref:Cytochrome P450 n=1 Tax=Acrasis kona TaxID=1008807 RepID=A0AAW2ZJU2_9EUKA